MTPIMWNTVCEVAGCPELAPLEGNSGRCRAHLETPEIDVVDRTQPDVVDRMPDDEDAR